MEAPISPDELVRPWRTATIVASLVAAVELVLLLGGAAMLLAKPLSHAIRRHAEVAATAPAKPKPAPAPAHARKRVHVAVPKLTRSKTEVAVLNGNGRAGAAASAAGRLRALGYRIASTTNAHRQDYATTVVLYRTGFEPEAARLARDLGVKVIGPLDGMGRAQLHGGELALILGA